MLSRRLWVTIVNNETAQQGVERGRNGALMCSLFFAFLAYNGWVDHKAQGTEGMTCFALFFVFAAWRIHRGSAALMDLAVICFPFGVVEALHAPAMWPGGHWSGTAYLFVLAGFELLNGVRGASYLHAPEGIGRREDGDARGGIGAGTGPGSPLRPTDQQMA